MVVLCDKCAVVMQRIDAITLRPTNMYSVDGCESCLDGKAGHEVYEVSIKSNTTV